MQYQMVNEPQSASDALSRGYTVPQSLSGRRRRIGNLALTDSESMSENFILAALNAQKRAIVTPAQIVRELQKNIPMPAPLMLQSTPRDADERRGAISKISNSKAENRALAAITQVPDQTPQPAANQPAAISHPAQLLAQPGAPDQALVPRADLKPLYDFTLDCQACRARLSAAQSDLADEKTKTAVLTKERDAAQRVVFLGAAAGAIAAKR